MSLFLLSPFPFSFHHMKILVCVSKTPDTTAKISFTPDGSKFNEAGVTFIMNPYDEWYALVRAVELVEKNGGTVTLINVGGADNDQVLRKGLAIGATDAVRIDATPKSALFIAKQIAEYARSQSFDLVFCGKESIDFNGSEVGAMVAEFLDLPFVSYASKLEMNPAGASGNTATVERDIEGGVEIVEVQTPFVLSAAKGIGIGTIIVVLVITLILISMLSRCSSCDPQVENCSSSSSSRSSGGSYGGFSGGGGHK